MKLTNGCAIFGDKNGPQGSGTYFSINKVMASLRAPSYANLYQVYSCYQSAVTLKTFYKVSARFTSVSTLKTFF